MSGVASTSLLRSASWGPSTGRRCPPQRSGAALPVARTRCISLIAADGLTAKRSAAAGIELPRSTANCPTCDEIDVAPGVYQRRLRLLGPHSFHRISGLPPYFWPQELSRAGSILQATSTAICVVCKSLQTRRRGFDESSSPSAKAMRENTLSASQILVVEPAAFLELTGPPAHRGAGLRSVARVSRPQRRA
jgi:hypothetical protein